MADLSNIETILALLPDFSPLPQAPDAYFLRDASSMDLPLVDLISTRLRPEGVRNAANFMKQAANEEVARRKPISVAPRSDGKWDVLDGNSTVAVARASRWSTIPCRLEASA